MAKRKGNRPITAAQRQAVAQAWGVPVSQITPKRSTPVMPSGRWYDPALDINLGQSQRTLGDLIEDIGPGGIDPTRLATQWGLSQAEAVRQKRELGEDYQTSVATTERNYGRSLSDLLTQRGYTTEDYGTSLADLQRSYDRLATGQTQQARSAGLARGGAFAQAAAKRAANQEYARKPIETSYQRAMAASRLGETRLGEDKASDLAGLERQFSRGGEAIDRALAGQGLEYQYNTSDLGTQLERAQREQGFFELGTQKTKLSQAAAAGWAPPKPRKPPKPKGRR